MPYVKLFCSILDSTVWDTPPPITKVWIAMLAMADQDGVVMAAIPALALRARVSRKTTETALSLFLSPDPDSRSQEHQGRRIEKVDGGWRLLNHAKYRAMDSLEERRRKTAQRVRRFRERQALQRNTSNVIRSDTEADPDPDQRGRSEAPPEPPMQQPTTETETAQPAAAWEASDASARWSGGRWLDRFRAAWFDAKGRMYGRGEADSRAAADLTDRLVEVGDQDRQLLEAAAPRVLAAYLAMNGGVAAANHPFKWMVERFNQWSEWASGNQAVARAGATGYYQPMPGANYEDGIGMFRKEGTDP